MVHSSIELVQVSVTKYRVIGKVELSAGVMERIAVAFAREVEPLERNEVSKNQQ